jgi:hypothetical protein
MPSPGGVAQFIDGGEFGWLAGWLVGLAQAPMKRRRIRSIVPNYTDSVQDLRGSTNLAGSSWRERERK